MEAKKRLLTYAGLKALEDELENLKVVKRKEVAQKIKEAREQGDLSENAEYDAAKDEQRDIEARIEELEGILKNCLLYTSIIGDLELDQTLTSRETINTKMRASLDVATDPWGIKVNRVELKNIIPPAAIQDAMEKQMKAERERREAILRAEGEKKSTILVAEGHKESAILDAEAEKQAAILRAEAKKEAMIREAEGEAEAIMKVQQANADGIRFLKDAGADQACLLYTSFACWDGIRSVL